MTNLTKEVHEAYVAREYWFLGELATDEHLKNMRPFEEN